MKFEKSFDWALIPENVKLDVEEQIESKKIYENNFRWIRNSRIPAMCKSYRDAYELGWVIRSPVDVDLAPIQELQLENNDEKSQIMSLANFDTIWTRNDVAFGIKTDMNLGLYEFKGDNKWESMFIINGQSSLEWRLGFKCTSTDNISILIIEDFNREPIGVVPGLLGAKHMDSSAGMSIAVTPVKKLKIKRGEIIARIIPVANNDF